MKFIPAVVLWILIFSADTIAQGNRNQINNDTLLRIKQKQIEIWEQERLKKQTNSRTEFLSKLAGLDPDSVTELEMNNLGLTWLPDLSRFYRLRKINASGNNIKRFNKKFFKPDSLKTVVLSDNPVRSIRFPAHSSIENVVIDNCNLKRVPRSTRKLKQLKTLECTNNNIRHIPWYIKRLKQLNEVNLNFNRVKFNRRATMRLAEVERVLLAGNNLNTLPDNINIMSGLKRLNLADNRLSSLPVSFGELDSLETIIFYKNRFTTIPDVVFNLNQLIELDFYYNQINSVSEKIGTLTGLKRIYLSFNKLESLPGSMKNLNRLKFLYIHHNRLKFLPDWLATLPNLTILDAGFNQLISIPDLSIILPLEEVDVQHNNLEDIPWKLISKPGIKRLYLRDNPFIEEEGKEMLKNQIKEKAAPGADIYLY